MGLVCSIVPDHLFAAFLAASRVVLLTLCTIGLPLGPNFCPCAFVAWPPEVVPDAFEAFGPLGSGGSVLALPLPLSLPVLLPLLAIAFMTAPAFLTAPACIQPPANLHPTLSSYRQRGSLGGTGG